MKTPKRRTGVMTQADMLERPAPPPIKRTPTPTSGPWYMLPNGRGSSMPHRR